MFDEPFLELKNYLNEIPGIEGNIGSGFHEDGNWWIKFAIDINNPLAWNVVQEIGHVVNYLSLNERLPSIFYPVSPPPYMNGGPEDFLSWVIESKDKDFTPNNLQEWLKSRLPDPVNDLSAWSIDDDDEDE
jgi:hypothetical protein